MQVILLRISSSEDHAANWQCSDPVFEIVDNTGQFILQVL